MNRVRTPGTRAVERATAIVDALELRDPEDLDIVMIAAAHGIVVQRPLEREEAHVLCGGGVALASVAPWTLASARWRGTSRTSSATCSSTGRTLHRADSAPRRRGARQRLQRRDPHAPRMLEPRWRAGEPSLLRLLELARTFGMSLPSVALRALLFTSVPCGAVCEEDGTAAWFAASVHGFGPPLKKGSQVPDARALGLFEERAPAGEGDATLRWWRT
jgi:hypothetical protein